MVNAFYITAMRAFAYSVHENANVREGAVADLCNTVTGPDQGLAMTQRLFGIAHVSGADVKAWTRHFKRGEPMADMEAPE